MTKMGICKHDILPMAEGTLAHVWGPVRLCHCLKTDRTRDNDVRENSLAAFESFTAQSCTNSSWKSYINVPVGETRRHQSQAGQHWARDSKAEGRSSAAVNQCTNSASRPWQPVKSLSSSAWCQKKYCLATLRNIPDFTHNSTKKTSKAQVLS